MVHPSWSEDRWIQLLGKFLNIRCNTNLQKLCFTCSYAIWSPRLSNPSLPTIIASLFSSYPNPPYHHTFYPPDLSFSLPFTQSFSFRFPQQSFSFPLPQLNPSPFPSINCFHQPSPSLSPLSLAPSTQSFSFPLPQLNPSPFINPVLLCLPYL